jgi:hypothetical protein
MTWIPAFAGMTLSKRCGFIPLRSHVTTKNAESLPEKPGVSFLSVPSSFVFRPPSLVRRQLLVHLARPGVDPAFEILDFAEPSRA